MGCPRRTAHLFSRRTTKIKFAAKFIHRHWHSWDGQHTSIGAVVQRRTTRETHKDGFVYTLLSESGPTAEELIKKRWAVIVSDAPVFATSDNPVMVLHEDLLLRGLGFFGGDILVPISPTRMMMLDDRHNEGNHYYRLHIETLGAFHGIVLRYALRFLISSRPSDEVLSELVALSDQIDREEV